MTRLEIIDRQLGQLLQERWKLVNSAEDRVPDRCCGAVAGMMSVSSPDISDLVGAAAGLMGVPFPG
jgi:hypothetical protein